MAIDYLAEITCSVGVTDLDRSIAWYERVLGCTLLYRMNEISWCEMRSGMPGVNVGLSQVEAVQKGGGATNVWSVRDIAAAKQHLEAHEVPLDGDVQVIPDMVKLLTFYDPDGNAWMLAETISQPGTQ